MATTQTTVTTANNNVTLPSSNNYIDQLLAVQGINALSSIFNMKDGLSLATVGKLVLYLSLDGVKQLIQTGVNWIKEHFSISMLYENSFYLWFRNGVYQLSQLLRQWRGRVGRRSLSIPSSVPSPSFNSKIIEAELSTTFWDWVLEDMRTNSTRYSYQKLKISYKQDLSARNKMILIETWDNIEIKIVADSRDEDNNNGDNNELICQFSSSIDLKYDYNTSTQEKILRGVETTKSVPLSEASSFFDYVPFPAYVRRMKEICKESNEKSFSSESITFFYNPNNANYSSTANAIRNKTGYLKILNVGIEFAWLMYTALKKQHFMDGYPKCPKSWFGDNTIDCSFLMFYHYSSFKNEQVYYEKSGPIPQFEEAGEWLRKRFLGEIPFNISDSIDKTSSISLSSSTLSDDQLIPTWNSYLADLCKSTTVVNPNDKKKVKTYIMKIVREKTINEVDNPEYADWQEKLKIAQAAPTTSAAFLAMPAPPRKLEKEGITTKVVCELENEGYKDFTTLYLNEDVHNRLTSCLNSFRDNRESFEELGIPYKFGLFLEGPPGLGKSSSILATASFLQRDIYCLDLAEVITNADLKMLFDHVTKQCTNSGIIVMEDMERHCKVTHKNFSNSSGNSDKSNADSLNPNAPLNQGFFLNLLQGSFTADGTVFIATVNNIDIVDEAFYRDGRMDILIHMKPSSHYQFKRMYKRILERDIPPNLLARLPEYKITPSTFIGKIVNYRLKTDVKDEEILKDWLIPE